MALFIRITIYPQNKGSSEYNILLIKILKNIFRPFVKFSNIFIFFSLFLLGIPNTYKSIPNKISHLLFFFNTKEISSKYVKLERYIFFYKNVERAGTICHMTFIKMYQIFKKCIKF